MRVHSWPILVFLAVLTSASGIALALFTNGGFEAGSYSGWTKVQFLNLGLNGEPPFTGADIRRDYSGGNDHSMIVWASGPETGVDPLLGASASLKFPKFGDYCARVNGPVDGAECNSIVQQTTVTLADVDPIDQQVHIRFAYAPVMEDPGHPPDAQPFFYISVKNVSQGYALLYEQFAFSGQAGVPWKTAPIPPGLKYTDWQIVDIAPGSPDLRFGDVIELEVIGADCSRNGHYGYVYVDGFGHLIPGLLVSKKDSPSTVVPGQNVTYTFTYQNSSDATVDNVVVTETIPDCATWISHTDPSTGGTTSYALGVVTCQIGTLAPGAWGTFTVVVEASSDAEMCPAVHNGNYTIEGTGVPPTFGPPVTTVLDADCPPNPSLIINTGWNQEQTDPLDEGSVDNEWIVVSDPDPGTVEPRPAFVIPPYYPAWAEPMGGSRWISSYPHARDDRVDHYVYEYSFCLEDAEDASISISMRVDDSADVYLNGNLIGSTGEDSFKEAYDPVGMYHADSFFQAGENILRVDVLNAHAVAMGLDLVGVVWGNVPEYRRCCHDNTSGLLGTVWRDKDSDGVRDADESGRPDCTVTLSNGNETTTDALGHYYFLDLPADTYTVAVTQPSGLYATTTTQHTVPLDRGEVVADLDFGARKKWHPPVIELIEAIRCWPNPGNPKTTISFRVSEPGFVCLKIYDVSGRLIRTLANEEMPRGQHRRVWDGHDRTGRQVASGVYFYKVDMNGGSHTDKIVILK